jgi:Tol biopolymer transport system component
MQTRWQASLTLALWVMLCSLTPATSRAAPIQLTRGPGDDTEAAWSPDGRSIVFQRTCNGDADLQVLNVATGAVKPLVVGPGDAIYPAWSPDGREIVYSFGHFTRTVAQGQDRGYNLMRVPVAGGGPQRLTDGLVRDYVPSFSPDGRTVYFSSTRDMKQSAVGLWRLALPAPEVTQLPVPERVLCRDANDCAAVQPSLSPDGRFIAYGTIRGMRSNWTITLAKAAQPEQAYPLTDSTWVCYGPRWSPDGRWLACTGYRPGDAGWGIYVIEVQTGGAMRLDTGPGNSRSPAWSPDGKQLVFENNRTGSYKLYRFSPQLPAHLPNPQVAEEQAPPVLKLSFAEMAGEVAKDHSGTGNDGKVVGPVTPADGGVTFGTGGYVTVPQPRGCDFGRKSFSVRADLMVEKHTQALRLIADGDYPICRRGWQLYLDDRDRLWFSARDSASVFIGACSDEPLPTGQRLTVTGTRDRTGLVELFVSNAAQSTVGTGANMVYPAPMQIRIGLQFDGTMPATGLRLYSLEVHPMLLLRSGGVAVSLEEFLQP